MWFLWCVVCVIGAGQFGYAVAINTSAVGGFGATGIALVFVSILGIGIPHHLEAR